MKKHLILVYLTLANSLFLLLGLEAAGQVAYRVILGRWVSTPWQGDVERLQAFDLHPYTVVRMRPDLATTRRSVTVTATEGGTRWTGAPAQDGTERTVVAVGGGSTAFGTGVSDADTWPALLQERLGDDFAVVNYGMPGFSTAEAIVQMELIIPEIDPDIVVFYEGWNDIHNYHDPGISPDYYSHGMQQFGSMRIEPGLVDTRGFVHRAADYSAVFRLVSRLSMKLRPESGEGPSTLYSTPDTLVDRIYERNLRTLKALAGHLGAYTVFVPQVLNERRYLGIEGSDKWSPWIENDQMPGLMRHFNQAMHRACALDVPDCVVVDTVWDEEWRRADFIDYGHFSREGGERFAAILADYIVAAAER